MHEVLIDSEVLKNSRPLDADVVLGGGEIDIAVLRLDGIDDGVELSPLVKGGDVGDAISIVGDGGQVSLSVQSVAGIKKPSH